MQHADRGTAVIRALYSRSQDRNLTPNTTKHPPSVCGVRADYVPCIRKPCGQSLAVTKKFPSSSTSFPSFNN